MPQSSKDISVIATASLRSASAPGLPRRRRSWLAEFFITPFTDINEELAERIRASSDSRTPRRAVRR